MYHYFRVYLILFLSFRCSVALISQDDDVYMIKKIHNEALSSGQSYRLLSEICLQFGGRIAGSDNYLNAANYCVDKLKNLQNVSTHLQDCLVPYWQRGDQEQVVLIDVDGNKVPLSALSLGNSVPTASNGLLAEVVEIQSLEALETLGKDKIEGKIVFFNRTMDHTKVNTFSAYGGAVDQRVYGPDKAGKLGAVAAIVRSVTTAQDDFPHTGVTIYTDSTSMIPGIAISTVAAERLSACLKIGSCKLFLKTNCKMVGNRSAPNVIAEIKGSTYPDEIILVGGHLDSWDIGQGAHDDGAGCVHAMEVLALFSKIGYQPKRTIRCVLFSNEENGLVGGKTYAQNSNEKKEFHLAAIESDAGGFSPRSFSFDADTSVFKTYYKYIQKWLPLLEPYGLSFEKGGSGADINPLKSQKGLLVGLRPDAQRYFDFHHTANDVIDHVHKRELEMGTAAMASLVFLMDKYGIK